MNRDKQKNMAMITVAGLILVATNLGVWLAAREGVIAPVGNSVIWGAFVALNVASILWAVILLGLQPLVVSLSYVAGGFLAFKGVQEMGGVSVAEVTTAGATYGAFGALAVGNATTKVRLAFYNKKQVPFIFVIAGLLVLDAVLNSGISSAGGGIILNAVVFPFVIAGVVVGLIWTVLNRYGIGYNPRQSLAQAAVQKESTAETAAKEAPDSALKIEVPEQVEEQQKELKVAVAEETVQPEVPAVPAVKETLAPAAVAEAKEEEFFPLEIDKDDEFILPKDEYGFSPNMDEAGQEDTFSMSGFDSSLYASGAEEDREGGVMVEEPVAAVALDLDESSVPASEPAPAAQEEKKPEVSAEEKQAQPSPEKKDESGDWLSGHMDLLNKLK